jgi:hypothetical protein
MWLQTPIAQLRISRETAALEGAMSNFRQAAIACTLVITSTWPSYSSADCTFLNGKLGVRPPSTSAGNDQRLFVKSDQTREWTEIVERQIDLSSHTSIRFAYVIDEVAEAKRSGVVIFKTGRLMQPGQPRDETNTVKLVRTQLGYQEDKCRIRKSFNKTRVSARSYDFYHDHGRSVLESAVLNDFHSFYPSRRDGCRWTANNNSDSPGQLDFRSNRGQYSFDPEVVDRHTYFQALAWFRPTSALASTDRIKSPRVEKRFYSVTKGTPFCIVFPYKIKGPAAFLRINDLESLSPRGFGWSRSSEVRITLSPGWPDR